MSNSRREFIKQAALSGAALAIAPSLMAGCNTTNDMFFKISLAQWSLHRSFTPRGDLDPLTFPTIARQEFGIEAIEYVNQFYFKKAKDKKYIAELKKRCDDEGVKSLLIMCDGEGALGDADSDKRMKAVENHYKWVETAKFLGCHSIRVNAQSSGTFEEQMELAADGLRMLCDFADQHEINVIVENHGGLSSSGKWLSGVMEMVEHPRCGTLPDFGNFCVQGSNNPVENCQDMYDRYLGMEELMPFAKGVSAKSHDFDDEGNEIYTDYERVLQIIMDSGYRGYIGIEYEGGGLDENAGVRATKELLERIGREMD